MIEFYVANICIYQQTIIILKQYILPSCAILFDAIYLNFSTSLFIDSINVWTDLISCMHYIYLLLHILEFFSETFVSNWVNEYMYIHKL